MYSIRGNRNTYLYQNYLIEKLKQFIRDFSSTKEFFLRKHSGFIVAPMHMRHRQQLGFAPPARWREMCMHSTTKKKPLGIHCCPPSYSTLLGSSLQNIDSLRRTAHCCPMSMTVQHIVSLLLSQPAAILLCTAHSLPLSTVYCKPSLYSVPPNSA